MKVPINIGVVTGLGLAGVIMGGCAMSPARIASKPTRELCIERAQTILTGHRVAPGDGRHGYVSEAVVDKALAERGASCGDAPEYRRAAERRIREEQARRKRASRAVMSQWWFGAMSQPRSLTPMITVSGGT